MWRAQLAGAGHAGILKFSSRPVGVGLRCVVGGRDFLIGLLTRRGHQSCRLGADLLDVFLRPCDGSLGVSTRACDLGLGCLVGGRDLSIGLATRCGYFGGGVGADLFDLAA